MSVRLQKIATLIREELSIIFLNKVQDPSLGLLTVTDVKLTPDLKIAKVYISIYDKEKRDEIFQKLESAKGFIKKHLSQKIKYFRTIPEITFYIDDTLDYVEKMENIFKEIHKDDKQEDE